MAIKFYDGTEKYNGCVLYLGETNYIDSTYFYAFVYDKDQDNFIKVDYDSDAFAGGGSAEVDATQEVIDLYRARSQAAIAKLNYETACKLHQYRLDFCHYAGVTFSEANRLFNSCGKTTDTIVIIGKLLHTKTFKSDFRKKMAEQVRAWLHEDTPKFKTPLSINQLQCCKSPVFKGDSIYKAPWNKGEYVTHLDNVERFFKGYRSV